jgi:F-type H+-transporting ATPase subunit epsilon
MKGPVFTLKIGTPSGTVVREIQSLRLADESGAFGILGGHADFLTVLQPSLGYYVDREGRETFFAADGGVFTVREGSATLTTREFFESTRPEELAGIVEKSILAREKSEQSFSAMLHGIEKTFIEKTAAFMRDTA